MRRTPVYIICSPRPLVGKTLIVNRVTPVAAETESYSYYLITSVVGGIVCVVILAVLMIAYLILRSGWDELPVSLPIAHAPLLLIGTGLQFLLVLIGFFDVPVAGLSWEIGAYLALIASVTAAAPLVVPAIRSWQASR